MATAGPRGVMHILLWGMMSARRALIEVVVRRDAEKKCVSAVDQQCSWMRIFLVTKAWGTQGVARHALTTTFVRKVPKRRKNVRVCEGARARVHV